MKIRVAKTEYSKLVLTGLLVAASFLMIACGGSRVLKVSQPITFDQPIATAADQRLYVALDSVVVRGGPGSWAKNADWDEYFLRIKNSSDQAVQVTQLVVVDSMGMPNESVATRKELAKSSKTTTQRYKDVGMEVTAGSGRGIPGIAAATTGGAAIGAAAAGGWITPGLGAAAGGVIVLAPVLAVGGVMRGFNHSKVNKQIESRQTDLPVQLAGGEEFALDLFFPIAPSPRSVELIYVDANGKHDLVIDTSTPLDGLHIATAAE